MARVVVKPRGSDFFTSMYDKRRLRPPAASFSLTILDMGRVSDDQEKSRALSLSLLLVEAFRSTEAIFTTCIATETLAMGCSAAATVHYTKSIFTHRFDTALLV